MLFLEGCWVSCALAGFIRTCFFQLTGRSWSLRNPLARVLLPPEDESPVEHTARIVKEELAKKANDDIGKQIKLDKAELKRHRETVKVLLLCHSESRKGTSLKRALSSTLHYICNTHHAFSFRAPVAACI